MLCRLTGTAALGVALGAALPAEVRAEVRRELSFQDALGVALAHNGELYLAQADVAIANDDLALAGSIFAPRLIGNARLAREDQPGTALRFGWTDLLTTTSLELAGRAPTGLTYSLGVGALADRFASPFLTIYDPAYTTSLTLSLTQPLLRGGWRAATLQPIVVASLRRDVSEQQLRVRLEQIVGDVEVAYWTLALAHKEREAREASLKLAENQVAESTRLVRLGTISELDVVDARAGVGRAQQELIRAGQQVADAEGRLRGVIVGEPDWRPDDAIIPTDAPDHPPIAYSLDDQLNLARRNRPDVIAARATSKAERAALAITQNELLPQLDLIASGSVIGFAGQLDRNYATGGISVFDNSLAPVYVADPSLNGGLSSSFKNLATGGNYTVSLGLRLELPLDNRAAQARHDRQRHVVARAQVAEEALRAQIDSEVRRSLALLQGDEALAQAADAAVAINEQLLAGMRKRFSAGTVTSFDVLRVSDELTRSRIEAARARASYRVSLARLATASGTLLEQHHIAISSLRRAN